MQVLLPCNIDRVLWEVFSKENKNYHLRSSKKQLKPKPFLHTNDLIPRL